MVVGIYNQYNSIFERKHFINFQHLILHFVFINFQHLIHNLTIIRNYELKSVHLLAVKTVAVLEVTITVLEVTITVLDEVTITVLEVTTTEQACTDNQGKIIH